MKGTTFKYHFVFLVHTIKQKINPVWCLTVECLWLGSAAEGRGGAAQGTGAGKTPNWLQGIRSCVSLPYMRFDRDGGVRQESRGTV